MNYLEKLLEGVDSSAGSLQGVEWKPLGEVYKFQYGKGNTIPTSGGKYPVYGSNGIVGTHNEFNSEDSPVIGHIGAYAGIVNWGEGKHFVTYNGVICKLINENVNLRYAYYHLLKQDFNSMAKNSSQPFVSYKELNEVIIPIPPLSVQKEIVRILDTFTELTAELIAELTARKQQYNFYREELLSFDEGEVEWKTLGEVALDFGRGKSKHRPRNDERLYGGNIPFIQTGDIRNSSHIIQRYTQTYSEFGLKQSKLWPEGTLCITIAANIAETSILGFDSCFPDSIIGFVANPKKTSSNYVEYLLSSMKLKLEEMGQGSAQSNINLGTFKNLKLPFPSLEEQERIVSILDKFDTLTNSISEGLPKEIELRQKQYEYYRDMLLTFPK